MGWAEISLSILISVLVFGLILAHVMEYFDDDIE